MAVLLRVGGQLAVTKGAGPPPAVEGERRTSTDSKSSRARAKRPMTRTRERPRWSAGTVTGPVGALRIPSGPVGAGRLQGDVAGGDDDMIHGPGPDQRDVPVPQLAEACRLRPGGAGQALDADRVNGARPRTPVVARGRIPAKNGPAGDGSGSLRGVGCVQLLRRADSSAPIWIFCAGTCASREPSIVSAYSAICAERPAVAPGVFLLSGTACRVGLIVSARLTARRPPCSRRCRRRAQDSGRGRVQAN